jgi:hypothetical protein
VKARKKARYLAVSLATLVICAGTTAGADPCTGRPDGATCDAGSDGTFAKTCSGQVCSTCSANPGASPRFVDNGDGTITDRATCLVWEKKDNADGIHDLNKVYAWTSSGSARDGGLFTQFLATLNGGGGFAGHHDWRIPTAAGQNGSFTGLPAEAESIEVGATCGDTIGGCNPPEFNSNCGPYSAGDPPYTTANPGCTVDGAGATSECSCSPFYHSWTDSTVNGSNDLAWLECYTVSSGGLSSPSKTDAYNARAVRGSMTPTIACDASPRSGCFAPGQSRFSLTTSSMDPSRNKLLWSWGRGDAVDPSALGDPVSTTDYALCVYANGSLLTQATIAHGSHWNASTMIAGRYSYRDSSGSSSGVRKSQITPGDMGATKAQVSAVGSGLASLATPLTAGQLPVRVQLVNTVDAADCWTADYSNEPVRNDAKSFQVRLP